MIGRSARALCVGGRNLRDVRRDEKGVRDRINDDDIRKKTSFRGRRVYISDRTWAETS